MRLKVAFYMTTVLNYFGGFEKWIMDTAGELSRRYKDLEIIIITRDDKFTESLNKLLAFVRGYKYDRSSLYKISDQEIEKKLGQIKYIKCKTFSEIRERLSQVDVVYSKNEILEAVIFKYIIGYNNIKKLIFGCHTALYYPTRRIHNILYTTKIYNFLTSGVKKFHVLNSTDELVLGRLRRNVKKISNPIILQEEKIIHYPILDIHKNIYNIVWVGRLTSQKGIDVLEKVINHISINYGDGVKFHIIGDGEERDRVISLERVYKCVKYYGHLKNDIVSSYLKQMNLFLLTSKGEGYPISVLEANAQNLPVLAFDIPGVNDIIESGKNGYLVKNISEYLGILEKFICGGLYINTSKEVLLKKINNESIYKDLYFLIVQND